MKEKINVAQVCQSFNTVRENYKGRHYNCEDITRILKEEAKLSGSIIKKIRGNNDFIQSYQREGKGRGKHKGYMFPYNPIHISVFQKLLYGSEKKKENKQELSYEEKCIIYLKEKGYRIYKPNGFNFERLKEENPELVSKYKTYKEL